MKVVRVAALVDDVTDIAEQLKTEVVKGGPRRETFQQLYSLRRSVETLEREVRDEYVDASGDAC